MDTGGVRMYGAGTWGGAGGGWGRGLGGSVLVDSRYTSPSLVRGGGGESAMCF